MSSLDKRACDAVCTLLNAVAKVSSPDQTARIEQALLIQGLSALPVDHLRDRPGASGFQTLIGGEPVLFYFQQGWHWMPLKAAQAPDMG